jgi:hypothetical protein
VVLHDDLSVFLNSLPGVAAGTREAKK